MKKSSFLDSLPFSLEEKAKYEKQSSIFNSRGITDVLPILTNEDLVDLQFKIFSLTNHLIVEHDPLMSIHSKLNLPFKRDPTNADWSRLMNEINQCNEFKRIVESDKIKNLFCLLAKKEMTPYPIMRFRAQFPTLKQSVFNWHQDEGVQYAMEVKDLAYWQPITLWVSVNDSNIKNSIELVPNSHKGYLEHHRYVDGQGHFYAELPKNYRHQINTIKVKANFGEGVFFHSLTFHRSIVNSKNLPRYSLDIRYCPIGGRKKNYRVNPLFALRRFFTKSGDGHGKI